MAATHDLKEGMAVVGSDKEHVGKVKAVYDSEFLVDRKLETDLYVPNTAVHTVRGDTVILTIPSYEVNQQGWPIFPHSFEAT